MRASSRTAALIDLAPVTSDVVLFVTELDDDAIAFARRHAADASYVHLQYPPSLERLAEIGSRRLLITSAEALDVEPLYDLHPGVSELSCNGIVGGPGGIDVARLTGIRRLSSSWDELDLARGWPPGIRSLFLSGFAGRSLADVRAPAGLTALELTSATRLESVSAVAELPELEKLWLHGARRITDLTPVAGSRRLRSLCFDGCTGITDLGPVASLTGLEFLGFPDCGRIESLAPVAGLTGLTRLALSGTTVVEDGDLTPLLGLPHAQVFLASRRHYRPPVREVERRLGQAG